MGHALSLPDAQHERQQRGNSRDLTDPEDERPAQHLHFTIVNLTTHARQPIDEHVTQTYVHVRHVVPQTGIETRHIAAQLSRHSGKPHLESVLAGDQHILLCGFECPGQVVSGLGSKLFLQSETHSCYTHNEYSLCEATA